MLNYAALKQFLESPRPTVIVSLEERLHPHVPPDEPDWPPPVTAAEMRALMLRVSPETRGMLVGVALAMGDLMVVAYSTTAPGSVVSAIMECLTNHRYASELPRPLADRWWRRCRCRLAFADIETAIVERQ